MPAPENSFASPSFSNRRTFLKCSAALTAGVSALSGALSLPQFVHASDSNINVLGPRQGYSPQVGTFVSLLTWMREANGIISATKNLTTADLDYLIDPNANTIGALMLHLAATETYYQLNTFEGMKWGSWSDSIKKKWDPAMNLGDEGRKTIKGHDRDYYLKILQETREKTLTDFSARRRLVYGCRQRLALGSNQQLLQVVPRLRARSASRRASRILEKTCARRQTGRRVTSTFHETHNRDLTAN